MIAYLCRYAPIEILEAMGSKMELLTQTSPKGCSSSCMHPNMCAYTTSVLDTFDKGSYQGMILTTCCDSSRRLYDVCKKRYPNKFFFLLDLPRNVDEVSVTYYAKQLETLVQEYHRFAQKIFEVEIFEHVLETKHSKKQSDDSDQLPITVLGARHLPELEAILEKHHATIVQDLTCAGQERILRPTGKKEKDEVFLDYAKQLLNQLPCVRMANVQRREEAITQSIQASEGVIYSTVKFCDLYGYEVAKIGESIQKPLLKLETDYSSVSIGQMETRVEAFLESIQVQKGIQPSMETNKMKENQVVCGIDSGSTTTCAVIMDYQQKILGSSCIKTGAGSEGSALQARKEALDNAGKKESDIYRCVSTGYGRVTIPFSDEEVTEITCHGKGAHYFLPNVKTILDIGGQDCKAISCDAQGHVIDFAMNDKCAAGTGRFLETMAGILQIPMDQLGPLSMQSQKKLSITSQCTVFAESEVISLIAKNEKKEDIVAAVHQSVAQKASALLQRVGCIEPCMMSGGVALNPGMVKAIEQTTGKKFFVAPDPEIVGAVGAALAALGQ